MEIKIQIPDIDSLELIKIDEDKPILVSNNSRGKAWRKTNLKIPKGEGIYLLFNKNKELIYIGETINLLGRISTHRYTENAFYVKFFFTNFSTKKRVGIEHLLIDLLNPKLQDRNSQWYLKENKKKEKKN